MYRLSRLSVLVSLIALATAGSIVSLHRGDVHAQAITLSITSPTNGATVTNPVTIRVTSNGVTIKAATDQDPNAAHYHYFIDRDPATVVKQGEQIPTGQPDIIHSADPNQALPNLAPGQHTVWVVLAHTDHTPYNPNIQQQVSFTVGAGGAQSSPTPAATPARTATPAAGGAATPAATATRAATPAATATRAATPAATATRAATPAAPSGLPANGDDFSMLKLLVVCAGLLFVAGGYAAVRIASARR